MAEASRALIGLICSLFVLSAMPFISAQDTTESSQLIIEFDNDIKQWYAETDSLELSSTLKNIGGQITIENDPSCGSYFSIGNSESDVIYDNSINCRGQIQDLVIQSDGLVEFDDMFWDFTNYDGDLVTSGWYTVNLFHSKTNIQTSKEIYFQRNIEFDSGLNLELNVATFGEAETDMGHHLIGITLSNPTESVIELPIKESCMLIYSINNEEKLLSSCYGDNSILHGFEKSYLGGIFIQRNSLIDGENVITVSTPGNSLIQEVNIEHEVNEELNSKLMDNGVLASASKTIEIEKEHISFLSYSINLENSNDEKVNFDFSNNCRFQMFIIDDIGNLIFDTSNQQTCQDIQTSHSIDEGEILTFQLPKWYLEDGAKCSIDSGTYTIILEIFEYSIALVDEFEHEDNYRNPECANSEVSFESEYTVIDDHIYSSISFSSTNQVLKINEICILEFSLFSIAELTSYSNSNLQLCDYNSGNYFYLPIDENGVQGILELEHKLMIAELLDVSSIELSLQIGHSLGMGGIINHDFSYTNSEIAHNDELIIWDFEGLWTNIGIDGVDCWMLSNNDESLLLVGSAQLPSWTPKNNWNGEYLISESSLLNEQCQSKFDLLSIEVLSVYSEQEIIIDDEITPINNENKKVFESPPPEITEVAIIIISTSSIFAILGLFVANTESIRIPTTAAGLWLLGILGKTQETSDGRFQRGRLMGYLTANPGCHFRALMAALKMSNGQITHHLRLLENQELIWRLRDGRLVRYYPLNNSLYPGMAPNELPIPPLSPDPNSLQGKILTLLDDQHQYGKFPTQAELALKLEKSQQLISHHLRTLQKFGLVEKRKMGIKNRYKLTKEALFLLETDIDFKFKE